MPKKKPKPTDLVPKQRPLSSAIRRAWARATEVDDQQLAAHRPRQIDVRIAEALLAGAVSGPQIAKHAGLESAEPVWNALRNPVAAAWISTRLQHHFAHRLGFVDAALFKRACNGDVGAIRLYYQRNKILGNEGASQQHLHLHQHHDVQAMTNDDLDTVIQEKVRRLALNAPVDEPDVPGGADQAPAGARGEGEADQRGPSVGVPPTREAEPLPHDVEEAQTVSGREPEREDPRRET